MTSVPPVGQDGRLLYMWDHGFTLDFTNIFHSSYRYPRCIYCSRSSCFSILSLQKKVQG